MTDRRRTLLAAAALLALSLPSVNAHGELTAHFRAESIDGGCKVNSEEGAFQGDPDRYFRIGIFDDWSVRGTCADGCIDDGNPSTKDVRTGDHFCNDVNEGCGVWNFTDRTISKVVPAGTGVYFYFGLFDKDPDADDLLGDHWYWTGLQRTSWTSSNNNNSPYKPDDPINTVCGVDVEKGGHTGNFDVTYSNWFTDSTGPVVSGSTPYNVDDGLSNVPDNDTQLDFEWADPSDPETGIKGRVFTLEDVTTGTAIFTEQAAPFDGALSLCPSGCDRTFTPQHGHEYRLRVRVSNGSYPQITNEQTAWTAWSQSVLVDLVDPTAEVVAPAASSWHGADFSVDFDDGDDGIGVDTTSCEWFVASDGTTTQDWTSRTCDASRTMTVGTGQLCDVEGADVCVVETQNADLARRTSMVGTRSFGIDWTEDTVGAVEARTMSGGMLISETEWTTDRDPFFSWPPSMSISPIDGYSWAINTSPDCGSLEVDAADPLEVQVTNGSLADGVHTFQIRAVDLAGNCGPVTTRAVQVDGTADPTTGLRATDGSGAPIPEATWQQENRPNMLWDPASSASPIEGYSYGVGPATDCTVDGLGTMTTLLTQPDGVVSFWVRAIDEAGNCGPEARFDLYVDTTEDAVPNLRAFTQQGGTPIMNGVVQSDTDPWMEWDVPLSTAPIVGYAWGTGQTTDCTIDTASPNAQLSGLPEGTTTFWVRAVDEAGNCGPASTFDIVVGNCGDGVVSGAEECDDGNSDPTDDCVACMHATCGDGAVWANNEECDDGDDNSDTEPDACRTTCVEAYCGDGVVDTGEGCDDGEDNSDEPGATCRTDCSLPTCGDGIVDPGEECDDGEANSDTEPDACRTMCLDPYCGDGVVDAMEGCDDGDMNDDSEPDTCRTNCAPASCGDGIVDENEICDDGDLNSDTEPDACRTTCLPSACGDGVVDSDEDCEPGDSRGDLICQDDCRWGSPSNADTGGDDTPDMGTIGNNGGNNGGDNGGNNGGNNDGNNTTFNNGMGEADAGPDGGGSYDKQDALVDSGVGGCCGVASGAVTPLWPALLTLAILIGVRRRVDP